MSKFFKYLFIVSGVGGGICLICFLVMSFMIASAVGFFEKNYSVSDLKEEYFSNETEIKDLVKYYNTIKPKDCSVEIEFKDDKILNRLTIISKDSSKLIYQNWNVNRSVLQAEELKDLVGWDESEIIALKSKVDKANCISVEEGEPLKIGFKRSGMGMFSFNIFQEIDTERNEYNNGCEYILVNRYLALQYGGGAIGSQCFPNRN